ncbi:MmgE/PrpD family protein [Burkholderia ubonensis]|uniref:2-methylcitrate dehydratase n=1 Tax=Burkholderia ubonensis TaxID=101571 RepID=A0A107EBQ6_9BURK|nr:MmgE/PrpD family protein [Burkholderia ubonensis]KWD72180.1 2-methylcitrate dehydratase [Burkholderia ubonensis]KWD76283.1 2-methylcitrate dehydratase [Burkholderia ubonensis]KWD99337.1 2-methylcitrate dehydratase [Burkholderia ubonensis]KWE07175.1 2-methylcitrate dehydratase [Burkholderia ubonensis]KWN08877.1 2-methylcitrate dehydratase [Burkholderia ubonensis]
MTADTQTRATRLAAFVARTPADALPDDVVAKAKRHVLDTFGAALAGAAAVETRGARALTGAAERGGAPLWGTRRTAGARDAAFVNGIAAHALELDDSGGCDHSGAVVLPAALAALACAAGPVTGRECLSAIVLGYDVGRRVLEAAGGYSAHNGAGWHSTLSCGVFGAAAASARVLGLDAARTRDALGHAASFAGGLWGFIHDGSQTKRLHAGRAAEGGVLAALLAREGVSGPAHVFDDVWGGFFNTFAAQSHAPDALTDGLGTHWKLMRCSIKPHASCRSAHAAVDAALQLADGRTFDAGDIERIAVRASGFVARMCGGRDLSTLSSAQMSLPYAVAAAFVFGDTGIGVYRAERRADPRIAAMLARIAIDVDPALDDLDEPTVTLHRKDGGAVSRHVPIALGDPRNPLSDDALLGKYRALAATALDAACAEALAQACLSLERLPDARVLQARLAGDADRQAAMR